MNRKHDPNIKPRYFHHPESEGLIIELYKEGAEQWADDPEVSEITAKQYMSLKAEYKKAKNANNNV